MVMCQKSSRMLTQIPTHFLQAPGATSVSLRMQSCLSEPEILTFLIKVSSERDLAADHPCRSLCSFVVSFNLLISFHLVI